MAKQFLFSLFFISISLPVFSMQKEPWDAIAALCKQAESLEVPQPAPPPRFPPAKQLEKLLERKATIHRLLNSDKKISHPETQQLIQQFSSDAFISLLLFDRAIAQQNTQLINLCRKNIFQAKEKMSAVDRCLYLEALEVNYWPHLVLTFHQEIMQAKDLVDKTQELIGLSYAADQIECIKDKDLKRKKYFDLIQQSELLNKKWNYEINDPKKIHLFYLKAMLHSFLGYSYLLPEIKSHRKSIRSFQKSIEYFQHALEETNECYMHEAEPKYAQTLQDLASTLTFQARETKALKSKNKLMEQAIEYYERSLPFLTQEAAVEIKKRIQKIKDTLSKNEMEKSINTSVDACQQLLAIPIPITTRKNAIDLLLDQKENICLDQIKCIMNTFANDSLLSLLLIKKIFNMHPSLSIMSDSIMFECKQYFIKNFTGFFSPEDLKVYVQLINAKKQPHKLQPIPKVDLKEIKEKRDRMIQRMQKAAPKEYTLHGMFPLTQQEYKTHIAKQQKKAIEEKRALKRKKKNARKKKLKAQEKKEAQISPEAKADYDKKLQQLKTLALYETMTKQAKIDIALRLIEKWDAQQEETNLPHLSFLRGEAHKSIAIYMILQNTNEGAQNPTEQILDHFQQAILYYQNEAYGKQLLSGQYNVFLGGTFLQIARIHKQLVDSYWQDYCQNSHEEHKKQVFLIKKELLTVLQSAISYLTGKEKRDVTKWYEKIKKHRFTKNALLPNK